MVLFGMQTNMDSSPQPPTTGPQNGGGEQQHEHKEEEEEELPLHNWKHSLFVSVGGLLEGLFINVPAYTIYQREAAGLPTTDKALQCPPSGSSNPPKKT